MGTGLSLIVAGAVLICAVEAEVVRQCDVLRAPAR